MAPDRTATVHLPPSAASPQAEAVLGAIRSMTENVGAPHLLSALAAAGFYSPYHFPRLFLQHTRTAPGRFLTALRMQAAKELLAETAMTVSRISDEIGYQSIGSFTTQFSRLVGISPGRFRELVDTTAGHRITDPDLERALPGDSSGIACSLEASCGAGSLTGRVTFVGLFGADLPQGRLAGFGMLRESSGVVLDRRGGAGGGDMFTMSLPDSLDLARLAVGGSGDMLVGRGSVPGGPDRRAALALRLPNAFDPPVVSAAPAIHLREFLR